MTNDITKELKRIYKRKDISDSKFDEIVSNLNKLKDEEPEFYYFNMGRFLTSFGKPDEAIYFLENAPGVNRTKIRSMLSTYALELLTSSAIFITAYIAIPTTKIAPVP